MRARSAAAAAGAQITRPALGILVVVPWDQHHGGVASVVGNLVRQLSRRGHSVVMLHPEDSNRRGPKRTAWGFQGYGLNLRAPVVPGRVVKSVIAFWAFLPFTLIQLRRIIRDHRIECINVHYPLDSFLVLAFCRFLFGVKLVVSIHGDDILPEGRRPDRHSLTLRAILLAADVIIAPSQGFLRDALACFPRLRCRTVAIHNGIDSSWWEEAERRRMDGRDSTFDGRRSRTAETLDPVQTPDLQPRPYLLCVAAHYERKRLDVLLRAFSAVRAEHPRHTLVLVGDGPLRADLEALAATLGITGAVAFVGDRPPEVVRELLTGCALFVLPTRYESFGIAVVEAMTLGCPVVATAVGGVTEIISDGRDGLLVPADDVAALATAIDRCLSEPAFAAALGEAAAVYARERFNAARMAGRYEAELTRLVSGRGHETPRDEEAAQRRNSLPVRSTRALHAPRVVR